jgi:A/G-specific adenine glycosylase
MKRRINMNAAVRPSKARKHPRAPYPANEAGADEDSDWVAELRRRLAEWYAHEARELPWRGSRDPYRILVSEMMLIQTTVVAVIPYFERFLSRFPDVAALAAADEADVVKAWEGLGYYRRARQLHQAARTIVSEHAGVIPNDPAAVRALPGVGRYIAGAILSFAFDRPEPILEANTRRVLARLLALRGELKVASAQKRLWHAAHRVVPPENPGAFNQALMDLGALICTHREPACLVCPVSRLCRARQLGLQDRLPQITPKPLPLAVAEAAVVIVHQEKVLILERAPGGLWERFWEFPTAHLQGANPASRPSCIAGDLQESIRCVTGITAQIGPQVKTIAYSVTKHRVQLFVHLARATTIDAVPGPGLASARWVRPEELNDYTFSSAGRRLIEWIKAESVGLDDQVR